MKMKNKIWIIIPLIVFVLNILASISLKNWYAMMGWFVASIMCISALLRIKK